MAVRTAFSVGTASSVPGVPTAFTRSGPIADWLRERYFRSLARIAI
jgi:hypothetical protein